MPVGFAGHGNPMNALGGSVADGWRRWGAALPRPRGILVVSAHFEASPPTLSSVSGAGLIYDFWGFPDEMYRLQYPAPPAPDLAETVEGLLGGAVGLHRAEDRGLDHGAWVPLLHLFPEHDTPTVQLSIPWTDDPKAMFDLGARLAPLRDDGYFILGSGNIVHNLRRVDWSGTAGVTPWAAEFDGFVTEALTAARHADLWEYRSHPLAATSHPTQEHFVPLLVAAGASAGDAPSFPVTGFEMGSISARSVRFG
jgi:4,5-DOPA dioxygenase extradiol